MWVIIITIIYIIESIIAID